MGIQAQHSTLEPIALRGGCQTFSCAWRYHYDPVRRQAVGLDGNSAANLLRKGVRVSRLGRRDCDLRLRRPPRQPEDSDRTWARNPLACSPADYGARWIALSPGRQGGRQVGQSIRPDEQSRDVASFDTGSGPAIARRSGARSLCRGR